MDHGKSIITLLPVTLTPAWSVTRHSGLRVSPLIKNRFLERVDFDRASVPLRQRVKILYMTQASIAPPTFVLFTVECDFPEKTR